MKITDAEGVKNVIVQRKRTNAKPPKKEFEDILDKVSTSRPETQQTHTTQKVSNVILNPAFSIDGKIVTSRVDRLLDVMEEYSVKLGDPDISLKDMSSLASTIKEETESLKILSDSLPPGDGIKGVIDEVVIRASVEMIKFDRGDYVA